MNTEELLAECDKVRARVSTYTPEQKAELLRKAREIIGTPKPKYNEKADAFLEELYDSVGAQTAEQKYNTLCLYLNVDKKNQSFSHNPSWEQKQAMMEYEVLELKGLIELTLA